MFRQLLQLLLRPAGDGVDVAVFVAHEVELAHRNGDTLGADTEETADVERNAVAVHVGNRADRLVFRPVNRRADEHVLDQLILPQAFVSAVVHHLSPSRVLRPNTREGEWVPRDRARPWRHGEDRWRAYGVGQSC